MDFPGEAVYGVDVAVSVVGPKLGSSGNVLNPQLFDCKYGALGSKRMARRASDAQLPSQYPLLRRLRNSTMLAIDDFFIQGDIGYLVIESADEKFMHWVQNTDQDLLFTETTAGKVKLSPLLRTMFLELVGLIDDLIKRGCYPDGLSVQDLYLKNMTQGGRPRLKVLLDYNVRRIRTGADVSSALNSVRGIIDWCCQSVGVQLDDSSHSFRNYIGRHKSARHLKDYPDSWSEEKKRSYIFMILNGKKSQMKKAIRRSNVDWVWIQPRTQAIGILEDICIYAEGLIPPTFYQWDSWSFIQLCRNLLKSFAMPPQWRVSIRDRTAFLKRMENWNPDMWTALYEQIGPLEGGELKC